MTSSEVIRQEILRGVSEFKSIEIDGDLVLSSLSTPTLRITGSVINGSLTITGSEIFDILDLSDTQMKDLRLQKDVIGILNLKGVLAESMSFQESEFHNYICTD